jgi:aspartate racemase
MTLTPQRWTPGLVGMATPADCAYLRAMQNYSTAPLAGGLALNRLRAIYVALDFAALVDNIKAGAWTQAEQQISAAAQTLRAAGADFLVITSNTGSTLAGPAKAQTQLPILDIVAVALAEVRRLGFSRAGLLSTIRTDRTRSYQLAAEQHGVSVLSPSRPLADRIERLIFEELIAGKSSEAAFQAIRDAASAFAAEGAECVILGCTDFVHLNDGSLSNAALPLIDTTVLHAQAAARAALEGRIELAQLTRPRS